MVTMRRHPWPVWVANGVMLLAGLLLLALIFTAGADSRVTRLIPTSAPYFVVVAALCWSITLRLVFSSRASGLEGKCVQFFARRGLPPRDAPATGRSALLSGAFIGGGFGTALAAGDGLRVLMATSDPGPSALQSTGIALTILLSGVIACALVGALVSSVIRAFTRGGRFEIGRTTFLALLVMTPWVMLLAPAVEANELSVRTLLCIGGAVVLAIAAWFFVLPAAVARARNHQWGLAALSALGVAAAFVLILLGALGPFASFTGGATEPESASLNLLLITLSGLRGDFVSALNPQSPVTTPHLDSLVRRGVVLSEAVTPATDLRRACESMLLGRYATSAAIGRSSVRTGLSDLLAAHGYNTAAFVSSSTINRDQLTLSSSFDQYEDLADLATWTSRSVIGRIWFRGQGAATSRRSSAQTVALFREWLGRSDGAPWFAWLELAETAQPAPAGAQERDAIALPEWLQGSAGNEPLTRAPDWLDPARRTAPRREFWLDYVDAVRRTDDDLGSVLVALTDRGELHRTIVMIVSPQGMPLGDEDQWLTPESSTAEATVQVPWMAAGPGVGVGRMVRGPCSLIDVAPTLFGLAGLGTNLDDWQGEDLASYLADSSRAERSPHSGPVFAEIGSPDDRDSLRHVARYGAYKLTRNNSGEEVFTIVYRSAVEPGETPRGSQRLRQELSNLLDRHLAEHETTR